MMVADLKFNVCPVCKVAFMPSDPCGVCVAISAAVAAEQERCAKVVEDAADLDEFDYEVLERLKEIAAKIRSGE